MHQKLLKSAHYIELGSYQYWPVLVPRGIRLYTYEQIPVSLKDNPYITDGYRAYLPSRLCIKSLFILSNETVNIWSHLLGFFLFFTLGIYDMTSVLPSASASREDFVICSICLFCFQVCMLCSVGYHLFSCHRSEKTCRRWMALDYAGISIGILGCYVSGVFYAFYCNNASVDQALSFFSDSRLSRDINHFENEPKTGPLIQTEHLGSYKTNYLTVLASSVPDHRARHDPGSVLRTDPSQLPHTAVAEAPPHHLLFCLRIWSDPYSTLGLAQWRNQCSYCTGLRTPSACDVRDCSSCLPLLHFQSPGTVLSRTTKLPRIEPPDLACPCSSDAVLVAPVNSVCHAVQTQQALPCLCFPPVTPAGNRTLASNDESGTVTAIIPLGRVSIMKIVLEEYRAVRVSTWQVSPRDTPCPVLNAKGARPALLDSCHLLRRSKSTQEAAFLPTPPTSVRQLGC